MRKKFRTQVYMAGRWFGRALAEKARHEHDDAMSSSLVRAFFSGVHHGLSRPVDCRIVKTLPSKLVEEDASAILKALPRKGGGDFVKDVRSLAIRIKSMSCRETAN